VEFKWQQTFHDFRTKTGFEDLQHMAEVMNRFPRVTGYITFHVYSHSDPTGGLGYDVVRTPMEDIMSPFL